MKVLEIVVFILDALSLTISSVVISRIVSKMGKIEAIGMEEDEKKALNECQVRIYKPTGIIFALLLIFVTLVGVALIAFPAICEIIGFNRVLTIILWWIPVIFNLAFCMFLYGRIEYDSQGFTYINALGFKRAYLYSDVQKIVDHGNIRVITKDNKKILLLRNNFVGISPFIKRLEERGVVTDQGTNTQ